MVPIDSSPREFSSVFTALLMSSSVLNFAGLKISQLAKLRSCGAVGFASELGIRTEEKRWCVDDGWGKGGYGRLPVARYSRKRGLRECCGARLSELDEDTIFIWGAIKLL